MSNFNSFIDVNLNPNFNQLNHYEDEYVDKQTYQFSSIFKYLDYYNNKKYKNMYPEKKQKKEFIIINENKYYNYKKKLIII